MPNDEEVSRAIDSMQHFIAVSRPFVEGPRWKSALRSVFHGDSWQEVLCKASDVEKMLRTTFEDDERFEDLLFKVFSFTELYPYIEVLRDVVKECNHAIQTLQVMCAYTDCENQRLPESHFCADHRSD